MRISITAVKVPQLTSSASSFVPMSAPRNESGIFRPTVQAVSVSSYDAPDATFDSNDECDKYVIRKLSKPKRSYGIADIYTLSM
jgi:hypothetical protein